MFCLHYNSFIIGHIRVNLDIFNYIKILFLMIFKMLQFFSTLILTSLCNVLTITRVQNLKLLKSNKYACISRA